MEGVLEGVLEGALEGVLEGVLEEGEFGRLGLSEGRDIECCGEAKELKYSRSDIELSRLCGFRGTRDGLDGLISEAIVSGRAGF